MESNLVNKLPNKYNFCLFVQQNFKRKVLFRNSAQRKPNREMKTRIIKRAHFQLFITEMLKITVTYLTSASDGFQK